MKTKLLFLTSFIVGVSTMMTSAQTTYEWDYVNKLQNEWLQKIYTQGLDTVYIVGRNGLIAHSTDRSMTWNKQYPSTTQLNDIILCNYTTGFAVGKNGTILRTTDAGISWTQQNCGVTSSLNAIAATGLDNIWAVGDSGKVVYSTNAGVTWQLKDFPTLANLNDISFRNNIGYIVGNAHTCFFSFDNGNNWTIKDVAIENPYNYSVAAFDLLSVNQTQNHACILIGDNISSSGWSINIDNNTFIHSTYHITNFTMKNDSIGFALSEGCLAGSSDGCSIGVQIFNLNKIDAHSSTGFSLSTLSILDLQHSDINFVNDSIEYIISGSSLFHLKRSVPIIYDGSSNLTNNKLSIKNNLTKLTFRFEDTKVEKIELYSITGLKVLTENVTTDKASIELNITDLLNGIYIIRVCYGDNTFINTKWIKQ